MSLSQDLDFTGRRVLVTGAGGVLGRALVAEADHRGATVVASGRSPTIDDAALPATAIRVAADLREPDQCRGLVHEAARRLGGLDIVVNNAATLVRKEFRLHELDDLETAWQVNLRYDTLDLNDGVLRGGTQDGYSASLVWVPTDYTRVILNYDHVDYGDAVIALPGGDRNWSADAIGLRGQLDF